MKNVLLALLLSLTLPASAALIVNPEKQVAAPAFDVPAFDQSEVRMVGNGETFLAVWTDRAVSGKGDVHATRVSSGGTASGPTIVIAATDVDESHPNLAWGGFAYLVVWSTPTGIMARQLFAHVGTGDAFQIDTTAGETTPAIAFNGDVFLVAWSTGSKFRGAIVDRSGVVTKRFDIADTTLTSPETPLVGANGAFHFVTAITDFGGVPTGNGYPSDVGVTSIDGNAVVGSRIIIASASTPVIDLKAASSGTELVVAWSTAREISGGTIRSVRVRANGADAPETFAAEAMYLHDVVAESSGFLLVYGDRTTQHIRRVGASAASGVVPKPDTPTAVSDGASNFSRTILLVRGLPRVGEELTPVAGDLYLSSLETQTAYPLVVAPRHQSSPDVAAAGDIRLAVWSEFIGTERLLGIVGRRIDANGNPLDAATIDLHGRVQRGVAPRVASNGNAWLVTWAAEGRVYGMRVSHDGSPLDASPFVIAEGVFDETEVAVSWDGADYVVVFFRGVFARGLRTTPRAIRVSALGAVNATETTLSTENANEHPAIASGTNGSLIAWLRGHALEGVLLSRGGTITPLSLPLTLAGARPAVAWSNGTFLLAAPFSGGAGAQIRWLLVSESAVVREPFSPFVGLASDSGAFGLPSIEVEAAGDAFLLYFTPAAADRQTRVTTLFAARIGRDGVLTDAARPIGETVADSIPVIGASGAMVVYARKIGHATRDITRVFARTLQHTAGKPRRRAVR
jgi:hypothetical protein